MLRRAARVGFLLALLPGCDPVLSDAINALGGEAPGVRKGPLHRPGQPCTLCHDGAIGDPQAFSIAGTIYNLPSDTTGLNLATVSMTDSAMVTYQATTNAAGNFYITPDEWSPLFPITSVVVTSPNPIVFPVQMQSEMGRNGSCATCHVNPVSTSSAGQVVMTTDDGGTPP
jgi:hypothetical protein